MSAVRGCAESRLASSSSSSSPSGRVGNPASLSPTGRSRNRSGHERSSVRVVLSLERGGRGASSVRSSSSTKGGKGDKLMSSRPSMVCACLRRRSLAFEISVEPRARVAPPRAAKLLGESTDDSDKATCKYSLPTRPRAGTYSPYRRLACLRSRRLRRRYRHAHLDEAIPNTCDPQPAGLNPLPPARASPSETSSTNEPRLRPPLTRACARAPKHRPHREAEDQVGFTGIYDVRRAVRWGPCQLVRPTNKPPRESRLASYRQSLYVGCR